MERPDTLEESYEPTYAEAFPPLSEGCNNGDVAPTQWGRASCEQTTALPMALRSSNITQVFTIPMEERRFMDENVFGDRKVQNTIVSDIMTKHDVTIEMCVSRDQSLSVIVSGKSDAVLRARKDFTQQLQQQGTVKMHIPKEHHRFIIGSKNKNREQMEIETGTRIRLPRPDDPSDIIEITGTKEGIEMAKNKIQMKSDEMSKLAMVVLPIPKIYHPFVQGPNGSYLKEMVEGCGGEVRVHVPPQHVNVDEISISGDKEGVLKLQRLINQIYETKKKTCKTISVEVNKSQHKYVTGPRNTYLAEILAKTGVWVEVPHQDVPSDSITLRGDNEKMGEALTMVCAKANSMASTEMVVESWLHRYIIGPKGANIRKFNDEFPKVHIELKDSEDIIILEGPTEDVDRAKEALKAQVDELLVTKAYVVLEIDPKHHKNIIGKNRSNLMRIQRGTGVTVKMPPENSATPSMVKIEGAPSEVSKVKDEILQLVKKLENEKTRDILIDFNLHKLIIGAQGARIKEIRDKFDQVQISFPDASKQSDVVQLRGQKDKVDKCYDYLKKLASEAAANNYKGEVRVFKDFHRNIIGKGGSMIKKIREETDTKIELPRENASSDVIVVIGKKENVEKAKEMIMKIQTEMANVKELTIDIPQHLHQRLIGTKGKLIKSISEECGGVLIRFPNENSKSDKVLVTGPKDEVDKAVKLLKKMADEKLEMSHTAEVSAKSIIHGFLIGAGGASINKLKQQLDVRLAFASPKDANPDLITIIGRKDAVEKAKVELEARIAELENTVESSVEIDPKHHKHFIARRAEVVNRISEDCGGISISFPKPGSNSSTVVLKGAKECVDAGKESLLKEVSDLENQVTIEVVIPQKYHGQIMGSRGSKIQEITKQHNVNIKLPERTFAGKVPNGGVENGEETKSCDVIVVSGLPENCEAAKEAMMELVPVVEEIQIPHDFHGQIIGQKGAFIRQIQDEYKVNLMVPPQIEKNDWIKISGPPSALSAVKEELEKKIKSIEEERKDRELKNFAVEVSVPRKYHTMLIGKKGASINAIKDQFDVNIKFPEKVLQNGVGDGDSGDVIVIRGYEKNANEAKDAILEKVAQMESLYSEEVDIDPRVHRRIIGRKGANINKLMETFKVDIRLAKQPEQPELVVITGQEEDVLNCRDELFALEEEFLEEFMMREDSRPSIPTINSFMPQNQQHHNNNHVNNHNDPRGFIVRDAPWSQESIVDFPNLAETAAPTEAGVFATSWGPAKKH